MKRRDEHHNRHFLTLYCARPTGRPHWLQIRRRLLPPIQPAEHLRPAATAPSENAGQPPSRTTAFRLPGYARARKPVPDENPAYPDEKETTMIKRHSDVVLEVTAHDPHSVENDLNAAVEIAREHAMKERRHGILVTQHGYTSYTVAVSRDVPYGLTHERREEPPNSPTETGQGR